DDPVSPVRRGFIDDEDARRAAVEEVGRLGAARGRYDLVAPPQESAPQALRQAAIGLDDERGPAIHANPPRLTRMGRSVGSTCHRSEEHTSELPSPDHL